VKPAKPVIKETIYRILPVEADFLPGYGFLKAPLTILKREDEEIMISNLKYKSNLNKIQF